jgi:putative membrane protein
MAKLMTDIAEGELHRAIQAIEQVSSAEVVIAVRPRLRRWLIPHLVVAAIVMLLVLAFVLFSDAYEFALWSIAVTPLLAAIAGGMLVEAIAPLDRALTPAAVRDELVRDAGRATFYELGVHNTKGRTGVLVFIAVREQRVLLIGDLAIAARLGHKGLARQAELLSAQIPAGGEALARALARLAGEYGAALPRAADDVNELADLVSVRRGARRFRGSVR